MTSSEKDVPSNTAEPINNQLKFDHKLNLLPLSKPVCVELS